MRGRSARRRAWPLVVAVCLAVAPGPVLIGATAAHAAPQCSQIPPGVDIAETPWAQRRLVPERLAPLADGAGVTVAVIDSGVDPEHPQLRGRVDAGADFLDDQPDGTVDCVGHGTAVASLIAAGAPRSGTGLRGLAPGVRIVPVRVSEQQTIDGETTGRTASAEQFAAAIRWAVDTGDADVLNLSVVLLRDDPAVRDAIAHALARDVVVVAAAGNAQDEGNPRPYPAAYEGVLGVGAIGQEGVREDFSQTGDHVDLVAPGGSVTVAWPDGRYSVQSGTSYRAPFVTATAALIRQYRPELTAAEVTRRIVATADPAPGGRSSAAYGNGVVNPYRALTEAIAVGPPRRVAPIVVPVADPATLAAQRRRAEDRERALLMAGGGAGAAVLVLVVALVLPRGARRRWRPAGPA